MTPSTPIQSERERLIERLVTTKVGEFDANNGFHQRETLGAILFYLELGMLADFILSEKAEAHRLLVARMQSELVSPFMSEELGTIDYDGVAEATLNFIETELAALTPKTTEAKEEKQHGQL